MKKTTKKFGAWLLAAALAFAGTGAANATGVAELTVKGQSTETLDSWEDFFKNIGSKKYLNAGEMEIKLISNSELPVGKEISLHPSYIKCALTLDLNGYTLTYKGSDSPAIFVNSPALTYSNGQNKLIIKDSSENESGLLIRDGTDVETYPVIALYGDAELVVESGTIKDVSSGSISMVISDMNTLSSVPLKITINGGHIISDSQCADGRAVNLKWSNESNGYTICNVNGGEIVGKRYGMMVNSGVKDAVTISGGTIYGGWYGLYVGYSESNPAYVTITEGTITSASSGIYAVAGSVSVSGGKIINNPTAGIILGANATGILTGGTIEGDTCGLYLYDSSASATITAGRYKGSVAVYDKNSPSHEKFITGGLFSTKPTAAFIADNYAAMDNPDEATKTEYPFTVGQKPAYVAMIGEQGYETLQAAIDAAIDGATITLLENCAASDIKSFSGKTELTFEGGKPDRAIVFQSPISGPCSGIATLNFKNLIINGFAKFGLNYYRGWQITNEYYEDCTIQNCIDTYSTNCTLKDCLVTYDGNEYALWDYSCRNLVLDGCTFDVAGKAVKVYNEGTICDFNVYATGCKFKTSEVKKSVFQLDVGHFTNTAAIKIAVDESCETDGYTDGVEGKDPWVYSENDTSAFDSKSKGQFAIGTDIIRDQTGKVTGGSFSRISEGIVAERFVPVFDPQTGRTVVEKVKVAEVFNANGQSIGKYSTLAEALLAAESGNKIEILDGTWGADAVGTLTTQEALAVRYKSLTIQPAEGATVTFTANVVLGYDDSSTANATMTVKNLNFENATLRLDNFVQATVTGCTFSGNGTGEGNAGALVIRDTCCKNHKSDGEYLASQVTVTGCSFDGTTDGDPAIRLRNTGSVTLTDNTILNSKGNGITFESGSSIDNTPVKTIVVKNNTITEWNAGNADGGGRAIRAAFGTLADSSTVTIENNTFRKETLGFDLPDFAKITEAGNATVSLENNDWNDELKSTVSGNADYYTVNGATPVISAVITTKKEPVAKIVETDVTYPTLQEAFAAAGTVKNVTIELLSDVDLKDVDWPSIDFNGTFDGKGYTISNLKVAYSGSHSGFIRYSDNGAVVKNVTFKDSEITGNRASVVIGYGYGCTVENVTVDGAVITGIQKCGGIVALVGEDSPLTVTGCTVKDLQFKYVEEGKNEGSSFGGLVGYVNYGVNAVITGNEVSGISFVGAVDQATLDAWIAESGFSLDKASQWVCHPFIAAVMGTELNTSTTPVSVTLADNEVEQVAGLLKGPTTTEYLGFFYRDGTPDIAADQHVVDITVDGVLMPNRAVAQIGEAKFYSINDAFAAVKSQEGTGEVTIKVLRDVKEALKDDYGFDRDVVVDSDVEGGVTLDFVSISEEWAIGYPSKKLTFTKNVTLLNLFQLFGLEGTYLYGDAEIYQLWAYCGKVNIMPSAKVKMLTEMIKIRRNGTLNVTGTGMDYDSANKQLSGGYVWADYPGTKAMNLKDTYVSAAHVGVDDSQGASVFDLTLDNATLELGDSTGVSYGADGGTISLKNGSLIIAGAIKNVTTITIDGESYGADPVKVIDYTGKGTMTLADFAATIDVTGDSTAYVEDNDLWVKAKTYVAQIVDVKYPSIAAAVEAAPAGVETLITVIEDHEVSFDGECSVNVVAGKNVIIDLNGHAIDVTATRAGATEFIKNNGRLTIRDTAEKVEGHFTGSISFTATNPDKASSPTYGSDVILNQSGTLVVAGGKLLNKSPNGACYVIDSNSGIGDTFLTVNDGELIATGSSCVRLVDFNESGVYKNDVTINGAYFQAKYYDLRLQTRGAAAHVVVKGGEFYATDTTYNCGICVVSGTSAATVVEVTGGKFNSRISGKTATMALKGGIYAYDEYVDSPSPAEKLSTFVAEGYELVSNPDEATKADYPKKVQEKTVTTEDGKPIEIDIDPKAHEQQGEKVPVSVTQELAKEILGEGVDVTKPLTEDQKTQIVTKLQEKGEDGMEGWQKYTAGFRQTDSHPLAPKGRSGDDGQLVLVTSLIAPKQLSLDTGISVKYILMKGCGVSAETGLPTQWERVQELPTPEFPISVGGLDPETYWKIEVEYTATKKVEVPVEEGN